jgi:glycerate dehydrogenase
VAYDAFVKDGACVPLEKVWSGSDVISLHCPLTPENTGMINANTIEKMKDGVILLNTSRGKLVDEKALRDALLDGKVYAAALDVVSEEPIKEDNPLLGLDNCIITPHIAWANKEARQRLMDIAVENLVSYLRGETINNVW